MASLRTAVLGSAILRNKLFQVEFLSSLNGDNCISMIYHRTLNEEWKNAALELEKALGVSIIGRSKKQRWVLSKDYVDETLTVNGKLFHYRQIEGSFTQPNAYVNQHMLSWAQRQLGHSAGDLLELYCGNGNFTVPLAQQFNKVLATEISKTSVAAAKYNFARNGIDNVKVCRLSSEEMTQALNKQRPFKRLQLEDIDLDDYQFSTVLVDPPRAGLDIGTLALIQRFERILYISCNPKTLMENLTELSQTHTIMNAALFDQFPYTDHIETGVLLTRKKNEVQDK